MLNTTKWLSNDALTCKTGVFPAVRHNGVRDITIDWSMSWSNNWIPLLSGESLSHHSAWLDVTMCGWRFERHVRVFNPSTQSNHHASLSSLYYKYEQEKRRQYDQRVPEVGHATFTPLVLSTTGGMRHAATMFYKRLASEWLLRKEMSPML